MIEVHLDTQKDKSATIFRPKRILDSSHCPSANVVHHSIASRGAHTAYVSLPPNQEIVPTTTDGLAVTRAGSCGIQAFQRQYQKSKRSAS